MISRKKLFYSVALLMMLDYIITYISLKFFGLLEMNPITNYLIYRLGSIELALLVSYSLAIVVAYLLIKIMVKLAKSFKKLIPSIPSNYEGVILSGFLGIYTFIYVNNLLQLLLQLLG